MNEDIILQLQSIMLPVAEKIGEGAEFGWVVVMKQQYVIATLGLIWSVMSVLAIIITSVWVNYMIKRDREESIKDNYGYTHDHAFIGILVGSFAIIASLVLICVNVETSITHFINPEYYAIEFFINLVK